MVRAGLAGHAALCLAALRWALVASASSFVLVFALFQKRILPKTLARKVARWAFWPTLPFTYARLMLVPPRSGLWTVVDETVLVGAAPLALLRHPCALRRLNVTGIINLCEEYDGPTDAYAKLEMTQLRLPTLDHVEPSLEALGEAVDFIARHRERGERVYVHCKAGHGRSAAVAFAWLLHANRHDAPYALYEQLAAKRRVRSNLWRQPNILKFHDAPYALYE
eukprot:CAMPEP_0184255370 /NCGR_PEP_ID=MMETSP0977-20130417/8026_1 /TAXON_ID=483370 /ORGANISM="non described non described, Strain CCMP2097" /LENGTH=222 /DNA_ID=CAMNT_0026560937 /DNA_START=1 /DNA_END=666 /DNA_ORIENTATION=-